MFKDLPEWLSIFIYAVVGIHVLIFLVYIILLIRDQLRSDKIHVKLKKE